MIGLGTGWRITAMTSPSLSPSLSPLDVRVTATNPTHHPTHHPTHRGQRVPGWPGKTRKRPRALSPAVVVARLLILIPWGALLSDALPLQTVPGWWLHLAPWTGMCGDFGILGFGDQGAPGAPDVPGNFHLDTWEGGSDVCCGRVPLFPLSASGALGFGS